MEAALTVYFVIGFAAGFASALVLCWAAFLRLKSYAHMRIPFPANIREDAKKHQGFAVVCWAVSDKPDHPLAEQVVYGSVPLELADRFTASIRELAGGYSNDSADDDD